MATNDPGHDATPSNEPTQPIPPAELTQPMPPAGAPEQTGPEQTGPEPASPYRPGDTQVPPPYQPGGSPAPPASPYGRPAYGPSTYGPPARQSPYGPQPYQGSPYQQQPYQQPYPAQPGPYGVHPFPRNSLAVWSLVLGIISSTSLVACCGLGGFIGIPAIVLGMRARQAQLDGEADNANLGTAGVVTGWVGVASFVIFVVFIALMTADGGFS
ncbi:hypothetical protein GCM10028784_24310 [Myceligenerans cantabricum]